MPIRTVPPVPSRAGGEVAALPTSRKGSRLAEDWQPKPALIARFRNQERVDATRCLEKFRNHFLAASGAKGVKVDWDRTFANWVLEEIDRGRLDVLPPIAPAPKPAGPPPAPETPEQRAKFAELASLFGAPSALETRTALGAKGGA